MSKPSANASKPNWDPGALRARVLNMSYNGQTAHIACAFSLIEIVSVLYSKFLRFNPKDPQDPSRDYLVLSKGHGVMALYACLRELNWITRENLDHYFSDGSPLRGLAESNIPGVEVTSGSMGHGLPIAVGIALGLKRRGSNQRVYCIVGDGELNEGPMWEALAVASQQKLKNLTVIVDANGLQAMGTTADIMDMEPLPGKFEAFGLKTKECNGHDCSALEKALRELQQNPSEKPRGLICRTIKGKGVSFMENDNRWHYTRLTEETLGKALKEVAS